MPFNCVVIISDSTSSPLQVELKNQVVPPRPPVPSASEVHRVEEEIEGGQQEDEAGGDGEQDSLLG